MAAAGHISAEDEAALCKAKPLVLRPPPDFFRERSPYFAEHVRRDIAKRYGDKMLYEGGLEIETTRGSLDRSRPPRRTSTSRCASWTSARAGAGRWPG